MNKKLYSPLATFLIIFVICVANVFRGINNHEPWRIAVAVLGIVLFIIAGIVIFLAVRKQKRQEAQQ